MRTIRFRGKRIDDTNQWEYGYIRVDGTDVWMHTLDGRVMLVIPETVGQFTGLQDKNGKEIYEGDIIESDRKIIHEIYYQEIDARFMAACDGNRKFLSGGVTQNWIDEFDKVVIGNIHDNPELLKGGEE